MSRDSARLADEITVVVACHNDPQVLHTVASIPEGLPIVVSLTPAPALKSRLLASGVEVVDTTPGNLGASRNQALARVRTPRALLLDSDTWVRPGCVEIVNEALKTSSFARAKVEFTFSSRGPGSRAAAALRDAVCNTTPPPAYTPGLGIRIEDMEALGGSFFDERITWTEDDELWHRLQRRGFTVAWAEGAVLVHQPVSLIHELRSAYKLGHGTRLQVEAGLRGAHPSVLRLLVHLSAGAARGAFCDSSRRPHRFSLSVWTLSAACALASRLGYWHPEVRDRPRRGVAILGLVGRRGGGG